MPSQSRRSQSRRSQSRLPRSRPWWLPRRRPLTLGCLDEHPNSHEVRAILDRVRALTQPEMSRLANGWCDNSFVATARDRALSPDAPLIIEVLAAFDTLDNTGGPESAIPATLGTAVKPQVAGIARKAIRDAVAAAYARPILRRADYIALIGPWRRTFPSGDAMVDPGITAR